MSKKKKIIRNILIIIAAVFVVFSIASFVIVKINFDDIFGRTTMTPSEYTGYLRYEDVKDEYDRELLSFESGENTLQGYLYGTDNDKGLVIVCHGLGGGAESYLTETLYFVDSGYQVFAYDNTGCYESEGKNCVGLVQSVIDLDAALTFIEGEEYTYRNRIPSTDRYYLYRFLSFPRLVQCQPGKFQFIVLFVFATLM